MASEQHLNHLLPLLYLLYLHEVTEALLTEDVFEEDQVLLMVGIWVELRGEQGQSLMQPCESYKLGVTLALPL